MTSQTTNLSTLNTKLYSYPIPDDYVPREHLIEQLERDSGSPLILISAPAGYGKSTLVSAWVTGLLAPHAWISLDKNDNDLLVFLNYFIAALQSLFAGQIEVSRAQFFAPTPPSPQVLAASLVNELDQILDPFYIVLDDYSAISEPAIHEFLMSLLRYPPRGLHLVLTCRQDPPLQTILLRARHQLAEIRGEKLRFNRQEITTFMQHALGIQLDENTIDLLEEKTEGWAASLRLASLSLASSQDLVKRLANLKVDNRYIMDYLASEVLSRLPPSVLEFLLKTSILSRLSGPLCETVTSLQGPLDSGQAFLEWLEDENLFTVPLDNQRRWFRYHHLFQELLKYRLKKQYSPAEIRLLNTRASAWYAQQGMVEEALSHALESGDEMAAVQLVESHRHAALNNERWQQLERWLRLLPNRLVDERPELLMLKAWILYNRSRTADLSACLDSVEVLLAQTPLPAALDQSLQAECDALRSQQFFILADVPRTQSTAQRALAALPTDFEVARGVAWFFVVGALQLSGQLQAALAALEEARKENYPHQKTFTAHLLISRCFIQWIQADLPGLEQTANELLELSIERSLQESIPFARYFLGCVAYQKNDLENAERFYSSVVFQPHVAHTFIYVQSAMGLVATYQGLGEPDKAREVLEAATRFVNEISNSRLATDLEAFAARLALAQGNRCEAQRWAMQCERAFPPQPMINFYVAPLTLVEILLDEGGLQGLQEAEQCLAHLVNAAESLNNPLFLSKALVLQAMLHDLRHEEPAALAALERAVNLLQPGGSLRIFIDRGPRLLGLLNRLRHAGVAPAYIAQVLLTFDAHAPAIPPVESFTLNSSQEIHRQTMQVMIEPLTVREQEIVTLLAQRLTNKEIAQQLYIAPATVKRHTMNIYQKLNTNNRRDAVAEAQALGLLSSDDAGR